MSTTPSKHHNPRLFDDSNFLRPGEKMPAPQFAGNLLDRLGVRRASRGVQEAGVREWLSTHKPSVKLERSLRRNGFGDILDRP